MIAKAEMKLPAPPVRHGERLELKYKETAIYLTYDGKRRCR